MTRTIAVFDRLPGLIELKGTADSSALVSVSAKLTPERPTIDVPDWMTGPVSVTYSPEPTTFEEIGVRRHWIVTAD